MSAAIPHGIKRYTETTKLPGGVPRLVEIWEKFRDLDTDGYVAGAGPGLLANIKGGGPLGTSAVCSTFTGTVIGTVFDPNYPNVTDNKTTQYVPMYNGGKDPLPFAAFYNEHNGNYPVESIVDYGLGQQIDLKTLARGDQIALDWYPAGIGHSVFCWDTHLNSKGEVDCFQMIGSHGPNLTWGVHVYWCHFPRWITGTFCTGKLGTGHLQKAKDKPKIFVDEDEITSTGIWFGLPGVKLKDIDQSTFRIKPYFVVEANTPNKFGVMPILDMKAARFFTDDPPPPSYAMKPGWTPGASAAAPSGPPGHMDVASSKVSAADVKADPTVKKQVPPVPAVQDPAKPLMSQQAIEAALQLFFQTKWITADPGSSTSVNDPQSKAAIRDFQTRFGLEVDGVAGKNTQAKMFAEIPACMQQHVVQLMYTALFGAKQLTADPGPADGTNHDQAVAATQEVQSANSLPATGIPDAATQAFVLKMYQALMPSDTQHGQNPAVLALYWVGNGVAPGGTATLRLVSMDLKIGQQFDVFIKDSVSNKEVDAGVKISIKGATSEVSIPIPASFGLGSIIFPRVSATIDGGTKLELPGASPLYVRNPTAPAAVGAVTDGLEVFFTYEGWVGPSYNATKKTAAEQHAEWQRNKAYTYNAYRVPGKTSWFVRGRGMVDIDGAPNTYHPTNANYVRSSELMHYDVSLLDRPLDSLADGPDGLQSKPNDPDAWGPKKLYVQKTGEPAPGYLVMATTLKRATVKDNWDATKYCDARVIPFMAFPTQVLYQANQASKVDNFGGFKAGLTGHTGGTGDYVTAINLNAARYPAVTLKGIASYPQEATFPPDYLDMIEINGKKYPIAHGLIGDAGNQPHIGECSYAFSRALHALSGMDWADILWMIHPGSGKGANFIPEPADIKTTGQNLFNTWGGQAQLAKVLAMKELASNGR